MRNSVSCGVSVSITGEYGEESTEHSRRSLPDVLKSLHRVYRVSLEDILKLLFQGVSVRLVEQ